MWWHIIKKTPQHRQIDPIECGAVCLGIILAAHGREVDSQTLRTRSLVSRNGADAHALVEAGRSFGLEARARTMVFSELRHLKNLAIIFVDLCHFVVLEGVRANRYYINDPARGRYVMDASGFRKRFSEVVLEFWPGAHFERDQKTVRYQFVTTKIKALALGSLAAMYVLLLASLCGVLPTLSSFVRKDLISTFTLLVLAALLMLAMIFNAWSSLLTDHALQSQKVLDDLLKHLAKLAPNFFDERPFLHVERALMRGLEMSISRSYSMLAYFFWWPLLIIPLIHLMLLAPRFALFLLIITGIFFVAVFYIRTTRVSTDWQTPATENFVAALSQAPTLIAMGHTDIVIDNLLITQAKEKPLQKILLPFIFLAAVILCANVSLLWWFRSGNFPLLRFIELILLSFAVTIAAYKIGNKPAILADENLSLLKEMKMSEADFLPLREANNTLLKVTSLSFRYPEEKAIVLQKLSFSLAQNEIVGVVGSSLSGVSTLFKIIAGHLKPTSGKIRFAYVHERMRPRIVMINDDKAIAKGALKDVLTLGDRSISDEKVLHALKSAAATDLFYHRPMGMLAPIKEQGSNLSSSEKFRLLLAQALIFEPDMLVLDDFFLAMEEHLQHEIIANIRAKKIALLFNSYEGSLLRAADRVMFLCEHVLNKIDSHEHLYFSDEAYRDLVTPSVIEERRYEKTPD